MVDGDGAHAGAAQLAHVEDGEIEDVEDDEREEKILGGICEDSHGGRGAQGYRKAFVGCVPDVDGRARIKKIRARLVAAPFHCSIFRF